MYFSPLQQYILKICFSKKGGKVKREVFTAFYAKNQKVKKNLQTKIISKSLERLIDRRMLVGYGIRTTQKWFIKQVKTTVLGRKQWNQWLKSRQKKLPL